VIAGRGSFPSFLDFFFFFSLPPDSKNTLALKTAEQIGCLDSANTARWCVSPINCREYVATPRPGGSDRGQHSSGPGSGSGSSRPPPAAAVDGTRHFQCRGNPKTRPVRHATPKPPTHQHEALQGQQHSTLWHRRCK
jgi:hypothetical protein